MTKVPNPSVNICAICEQKKFNDTEKAQIKKQSLTAKQTQIIREHLCNQ
jgi:hypothetical protein